MGLTGPFNCSDLAHADAYSVGCRFMFHASRCLEEEVFLFCSDL